MYYIENNLFFSLTQCVITGRRGVCRPPTRWTIVSCGRPGDAVLCGALNGRLFFNSVRIPGDDYDGDDSKVDQINLKIHGPVVIITNLKG